MLTLETILQTDPEFRGFRLMNAGQHNQRLAIKSGYFEGFPREHLCMGIKLYLEKKYGLRKSRKKIWRGVTAVALENEIQMGAVDRLIESWQFKREPRV